MRWFVSPPHTSNTSSPRAEACGVAAREVVRLVVAAAGTAAVRDLNGGGGVAFSCVAGSAGGGGTGRSAGGGVEETQGTHDSWGAPVGGGGLTDSHPDAQSDNAIAACLDQPES